MGPGGKDESLHWQDTARAPGPSARREELFAPRTQIVPDRDAYLGQGRHDVGRRISDDQVELFISADVAGALHHEFTQHAPHFVALHDVATNASLRLLHSLAGAAGARVQRLSIRRQGHGVALAVLPFVEVKVADGTPVRVYTTDFDADAAVRAQVARVLLAHSRLGVLLVGELPANALAGQIAPLHEALARGPWPNRDLLLLPLASSIALAPAAALLKGGTAVAVHVAPKATKPRQAWGFIAGAWNRLHAQAGAAEGLQRALPTEIDHAVPRPQLPPSEAPTEAMPLDPLEAPGSPQPARPNPWQGYADRCALIKGCIACCVFRLPGGEVLAHTGGPPSAARLAQRGTMLLTAAADTARALGMAGAAQAAASVSTAGHHLLLHVLPAHTGAAVHVVLQSAASNLLLARLQLERIDPPV